MNITDLFDPDFLQQYVDDGLVRRQHHPTEPLAILNYTQRAQWSGSWDPITRSCRGLIYNTDTGEVVARPFPKFHNLEEHVGDDAHAGPLDMSPPIAIYEKVDGSLGIAYVQPSDGRIAWATRGSFTSVQALWATTFWRERERVHLDAHGALPLDPDELTRQTVLAEIVYPANRIVVDYGDTTQLVLLAILDIETGIHLYPSVGGEPELSHDTTWAGGTVAFHLGYLETPDASQLPLLDNAEGFVLLSGDRLTRVKVKLTEYKRLHALLTGVNARTIWEHLRVGGNVDRLRDNVPDEFLRWVDTTVDELTAVRDQSERDARSAYVWTLRAVLRTHFDMQLTMHDDKLATSSLVELPLGDLDQRELRKQFAILAKDRPHARALFLLLDGNIEKLGVYLWATARPESLTPFTPDPDLPEEG